MENGLPHKQKVLIVDDTPSNLLILGEALRPDYEVFVATDGEDALQKALANPPDLILLDVLMPGMDGYEVCHRLKGNNVTQSVPVMFITARDSEEDEVKGLGLGAVDYITKPFRIPIVQARVRTHMELKLKTDILQNMSHRDGLTGIFNRRHADTAMTSEWKRAVRQGLTLSVMLLDLDHFKLFNDNYGHLAGDECLKAVASLLASTVKRSGDVVARYGGEEFVIILPDTPLDKALVVAEKVRQAVEDLDITHQFSLTAPQVTVSIGVASAVPQLDSDTNVLLEVADHALYDAKQAGRNRVHFREI